MAGSQLLPADIPIGIRRCGERRQAQGKETADGNDSQI